VGKRNASLVRGIEDMLHKGCDPEKQVLSRALRWHLENQILVYQNKTIVFV
jgi:formyltetrahydrofolate deformylase